MIFCTVVNCMDGRVQTPVNTYLQGRFAAAYVDTVTEPGPNRILAECLDERTIASILERVRISVEKHGSRGIAVVGHADCSGNPNARDVQDAQTRRAVAFLAREFPDAEILGLWVDETWQVHALEQGAAP